MKKIERDFLNVQIYSIYKAVFELCGREMQEQVVKRSGEVVFEEIKDHLSTDGSDPTDLVQTLLNYLKESGYLSKGEVEKVNENELMVYLHGGACYPAVVKLKNAGAYPPHLATTLIFGGLKDIYQMKAKIAHLHLKSSEKVSEHTKERWILEKLGSNS